MIGVVCASGAPQDYIDKSRNMWKNIVDDAVPEFRSEKVKYESGVAVMPWKQATQVMLSQMEVMRQLKTYG